MHDTLYAAVLIPLAVFNDNHVSTNTSILPFARPGTINSGLPLYGFVQGDPLKPRKLVPDRLKKRQVLTDHISLLNCKGNREADGADDTDALEAVEKKVIKSRDMNQPGGIETARQRFIECLNSNPQTLGNRLQECICLELSDLDSSNPMTFPDKLGPRALDIDGTTPEFDDYIFVRRDKLCPEDYWDRNSGSYADWWPVQPKSNECRDLDIYDEYDEFKRLFMGQERSLPEAYAEWSRETPRGPYDWRYEWDVEKRRVGRILVGLEGGPFGDLDSLYEAYKAAEAEGKV
ncbi:hypothetical protein BJ508DRAFT_315034 [Ascobolus immersus RN42]|uniref:Uncharacterized protein n=1 Tax=Ascobolus immersus RN42 TaxID=1160509 RepID=A0A3N4HH11_ASCIM|nr:hypothetical protein BJ508DRAFT_315034 [Ascobolus immersus RN42]